MQSHAIALSVENAGDEIALADGSFQHENEAADCQHPAQFIILKIESKKLNNSDKLISARFFVERLLYEMVLPKILTGR